ncbi:MAG: TauD/TfdA family dioxygenase [Proteobacteria bacterium]|nr:TauD/TfdA family dioxygenase [Pseudomonadota bacterium]
MKVRRIADALGAEVTGIDLSGDLPADAIAELRRQWRERLVLVFPGQDLPPAAFDALARKLGEPMDYPYLRGIEGFPKITEVAKLEGEAVNFGGIWHSDTTYLPEPPAATMLLAREVPPSGGDTLFANQYLAYEALTPDFRAMIDPLRAVNTSAKRETSRTRADRMRDAGNGDAADVMTAVHPVVRTHPETGRKALFVNRAHTACIEGWSEKESEPLLGFLFEYQTQPEFVTRICWKPGTLALWDNRCTLHLPLNDYQGCRSVMHRITLKGDAPV